MRTSGMHKIIHTGFPGAAREAHARYTMRRLPIDYISDGRTAYMTFPHLTLLYPLLKSLAKF